MRRGGWGLEAAAAPDRTDGVAEPRGVKSQATCSDSVYSDVHPSCHVITYFSRLSWFQGIYHHQSKVALHACCIS